MKTLQDALTPIFNEVKGLPEMFMYQNSPVYIKGYHIEKYIKEYNSKTKKGETPEYFTRLYFDLYFLNKKCDKTTKSAGTITVEGLKDGIENGAIIPIEDVNDIPEETLGTRHKIQKFMFFNIKENNTSGTKSDIIIVLHKKLLRINNIWVRRNRGDFPNNQWVTGHGFLNKSSNGISMSYISDEERNDENVSKWRRSPRHVFSNVHPDNIGIISEEELKEIAIEYLV